MRAWSAALYSGATTALAAAVVWWLSSVSDRLLGLVVAVVSCALCAGCVAVVWCVWRSDRKRREENGDH